MRETASVTVAARAGLLEAVARTTAAAAAAAAEAITGASTAAKAVTAAAEAIAATLARSTAGITAVGETADKKEEGMRDKQEARQPSGGRLRPNGGHTTLSVQEKPWRLADALASVTRAVTPCEGARRHERPLGCSH